ncbi:MAG: MOSC domain-containing protein [bacterium]
MSARILSISTGRVVPLVLPNPHKGSQKTTRSAIVKSPVSSLHDPQSIVCQTMGLEGDQQANHSVHGGRDKAVYCYPAEHYPFWKGALKTTEDKLARLDQHGAFGENLTIEGLTEEQVYIGDVWQIEEVQLEIKAPREPCFKFNALMGDRLAGKKMFAEGLSGWYLSVLSPGVLRAGDQIKVISGPREKSIAEVFKDLGRKTV